MTLPDGGGAPEGRRERKTGSFYRKIVGFSGLSILARRPRSSAKHSEARPISPSAAPPQLPRQEELSPGRARNAPESVRDVRRCCRNTLIHSEIRRFVPVSYVLRARRFYLLLTGEVPRRGGGREKTGSFYWKIFGFSRF